MNKKLLYSILIISVLVALTGCTGGQPAQPQNPVPTTYTVRIMSGSADVWGNVYVNGLPSGAYLIPWGAVTISGVPVQAAIYIVDENGFVSHTEIFNPMFGTTIIFDRF